MLRKPVSGAGYQTGIRSSNGRRVPIVDTLSTCGFCSLRGLDLNQRPLGYESCISGSAQVYPLLTSHLRSSMDQPGSPSARHDLAKRIGQPVDAPRCLGGFPGIHMSESRAG
jgi:hypothetical protein